MTSRSSSEPDASNGYEEIASAFIAARDGSIGVEVVRDWARNLQKGAAILDLGCGTGVPISQSLVEDGFRIYGVDASPTLAAEFGRRFPRMSVSCEPVETSAFFNRSFDGVVAIGLLFLLTADLQRLLICKVAAALNPGGHFLFASPFQVCEWVDLLTKRKSRSLGKDAYSKLLSEAGLVLVRSYTGERGNYYFHALRPKQAFNGASLT